MTGSLAPEPVLQTTIISCPLSNTFLRDRVGQYSYVHQGLDWEAVKTSALKFLPLALLSQNPHSDFSSEASKAVPEL